MTNEITLLYSPQFQAPMDIILALGVSLFEILSTTCNIYKVWLEASSSGFNGELASTLPWAAVISDRIWRSQANVS